MESNANAHTHTQCLHTHALTQILTTTNESQTSAEQRLHAKQHSTKSSNARQGCTKVQRQPASQRTNDRTAGADQGIHGVQQRRSQEAGAEQGRIMAHERKEGGCLAGQALEADDEQATLQGKG